MAPRKKTPALPGVTGGETVTPSQVDHGLGRKSELLDALAEEAQQQNVTNYTPPAPLENKATAEGGNPIAVPLQNFLVEQADKIAGRDGANKDMPQDQRELIEQSVRDALKELLPVNAMLFVRPEEFAAMREELMRCAEEMIKETRALASKLARKIKITEEALLRGLRRDLSSPEFRRRHSELFGHIGKALAAPLSALTRAP